MSRNLIKSPLGGWDHKHCDRRHRGPHTAKVQWASLPGVQAQGGCLLSGGVLALQEFLSSDSEDFYSQTLIFTVVLSMSTHHCDCSLTPRKLKQRWSCTTSAPTPTATIGGQSNNLHQHQNHLHLHQSHCSKRPPPADLVQISTTIKTIAIK